MINIRQVYETAYRDDRAARRDIPLNGWPKNRHQASLFWAGKGERVLDVGCGNGLVLYNLRHQFNELHGTELADTRVKSARETLKGLPAEIIQNNIENGLPYPDNYFDTLISGAMIEHLIDVAGALAEMRRVLKPGGRLVLITPNVAKLMNRVKLAMGRFPSTSTGNEGVDFSKSNILMDGGHFHYFTFRSMTLFCRKAGFRSIERYGFGSLGKVHHLFPSVLSGNVLILARK